MIPFNVADKATNATSDDKKEIYSQVCHFFTTTKLIGQI